MAHLPTRRVAGVIRELQSARHVVIAAPNPAQPRLRRHSAIGNCERDRPSCGARRAFLRRCVITQASAGLDNVTALVYLAAFGSTR